jgi:hypothetical protein
VSGQATPQSGIVHWNLISDNGSRQTFSVKWDAYWSVLRFDGLPFRAGYTVKIK